MTTITFWEKPGCGGNARQRAILEAAGHTLVVKSILDEPWTRQRLLEFFEGLPVAHWFNRAAVEVKNGEIVPEMMDATTAVSLMVNYPLLIRRPLMKREDGCTHVGFVLEEVDDWVGLGDAWPAEVPRPATASLEGCMSKGEACPPPRIGNEATA
jgi:nitrogenase-associated protein